jgi:hypothetical protein
MNPCPMRPKTRMPGLLCGRDCGLDWNYPEKGVRADLAGALIDPCIHAKIKPGHPSPYPSYPAFPSSGRSGAREERESKEPKPSRSHMSYLKLREPDLLLGRTGKRPLNQKKKNVHVTLPGRASVNRESEFISCRKRNITEYRRISHNPEVAIIEIGRY